MQKIKITRTTILITKKSELYGRTGRNIRATNVHRLSPIIDLNANKFNFLRRTQVNQLRCIFRRQNFNLKLIILNRIQ